MIERRTSHIRYLLNITGVHPISFRMLLKVMIILISLMHIMFRTYDDGTLGGTLDRLFPTLIAEGSADGVFKAPVYDLYVDPKNLGVKQ